MNKYMVFAKYSLCRLCHPIMSDFSVHLWYNKLWSLDARY